MQRPEMNCVEGVEARVEWFFTRRAAAAAARAAHTEALLAARRQRLEDVLARLREVASPVLGEVAVALRQQYSDRSHP